MRESHVILGVHVTERAEKAARVQEILTSCAGLIKTRLGLHEPQGEHGAPNGLLLLELRGGEKQADDLAGRLRKVEGIEVQKMVFDH